ncbi:hypothetical protein CC77DRAFT_358689 [Alternaria alternata]|uniref:Uncharacterized protein n=1 Tax=Alternaria alternata TaxID=5599 RepID=A0A177DCM6_ALTAL|nr:hypothetical protein CC77DRAFT_358689 [Alternaria alternata]OAG16850.1 hypothetical protein CC77DRAFT_358689 [Alternaria alternata]
MFTFLCLRPSPTAFHTKGRELHGLHVIPCVLVMTHSDSQEESSLMLIRSYRHHHHNKKNALETFASPRKGAKRMVRRIPSKLRHVVPFVDRTRYLQI